MAISDNFTLFAANLAKLPQQKIAQAISLLLLIYIAFLAAKITWLLVPQAPITSTSTLSAGVKQTSSTGQHFNLSALQSLNLFGQYNEQVKEVVQQITDAPVTRLKLTLSGLVASDKTETAAAIIEYQGKQETYGIGDVILGTRASLEQVLIDRVIIKQLGRLETLMLDGADYNQPAQNIANKKETINARVDNGSRKTLNKANVVDLRSNNELTRNAVQLRSDISKDPGKITDYLRISPARENGKIIGYRLSPGKKPEFFKLSGLKSGDIAVQMNGYDLRAPLEAAQALSALKTERDISLLIERKNDLIEILFSID
ncbi:type II secretion system protein GspC [Candidatus Colwellia aromaticivorans]|uniref:type II secretion system protein GspC n=1 Tax=Candidatus Colwellia aromaticivorans TaxID=2267621 RepID=UPI000DF2BDDD|nr:type II secretion system protein GspC [Candidatus Colwellia aromaticivorans]